MKPIFIAGKVKVRKEMNMNCSDNMLMVPIIHSAVCSLKEHRGIQSEGYWIRGKGLGITTTGKIFSGKYQQKT